MATLANVFRLSTRKTTGWQSLFSKEAEMRIFRRQSRPGLPPLVEPPKPGEPIVPDEEEKECVEREVGNFLELLRSEARSKDRELTADTLQAITDGIASQELARIAKHRLETGRLHEAALSCIKAIGMDPENALAWVRLARAHALYGDYPRAKNCLNQSARIVKKLGLRDDAEPWSSEIRAVRQQLSADRRQPS